MRYICEQGPGEIRMSEETPDCLHIGGTDIKGYEDNPYLWMEEVCDMIGCQYRDGCRFYLEYWEGIDEELEEE
jgi:hypothetical protein